MPTHLSSKVPFTLATVLFLANAVCAAAAAAEGTAAGCARQFDEAQRIDME